MSTAIAEKPVAEEVTLPPAGGAPTAQQKEAFLSLFKGKNKAPKEAVTEPVKEVMEVVKNEPVTAEPVKEEVKKVEPVKEEKPLTDQERDFAGLRKKAEAADKAAKEAAEERDRLRAEYEEYKKKPAPEEFVKELELTKKEKAEYQKRLREADLSRDPEFNAQYDTPIRGAMQRMVDIAVAAGIPKDDAVKAVSSWNKNSMADWLDSTLGPVERMEFGAEMQRATSLYSQKEEALAAADQTWQGLQKQREENKKLEREQYLSTLNSDIEAIIKEASETPLGKEHTEVLTEAKSLLRRAGGLEGERIANKDLLGMVGKSLLLSRGFQKQEKLIAEKEAKIAEMEKTIAERDDFIKGLHGATPPIGGSLPAKGQDAKARARAILNPTIS